MSHLQTLQGYIQQLHHHASQDDVTNTAVSQGSIHRHADHVLRSTKLMLEGIVPNDTPKPTFNPIKSMIMLTGWMPRGVAQSPDNTVAHEPITQETFAVLFTQVEALIADYKDSSELRMSHPAFGDMSARDVLKFAAIHAKHHLKIIKDIVK